VSPEPPDAPAATGPLAGVTVLEFGQLLAGPYVGSLLADFGADVIKVEAPPAGDPMRDWGRLRSKGHSLWWPSLGRNKRSVTLNLRTPRGQEIAAALCENTDVIVENFKPGTMERWGIGPEDVHAANPGCIYARVSGYGQSGRYRDRVGFASGGEAMGGLRYINGYPDQAPPRCGISLGDTLAAQSAFQGILMALYHRDARGGTGKVIDAAILDACFAMLESTSAEYDQCGVVREPTGSYLPRIAPSNVFLAKDKKWVVIAANHDTLWRRLAALMGRPELGDDPRYADHHGRGEHEQELYEMIGAWAAQYTAAELDEMVNDANVVCAPVYSIADIFADPHFRERELLITQQDSEIGEITVPGIVPKLSATPGNVRWSGKWQVGADNEAVLGGLLGLGAEELEQMRVEGVV
jgi:crotonobetainyl-CoA:carnitine CoA-transferase CaiB-like acyl-CoA transferase